MLRFAAIAPVNVMSARAAPPATAGSLRVALRTVLLRMLEMFKVQYLFVKVPCRTVFASPLAPVERPVIWYTSRPAVVGSSPPPRS